MIKLYHGSTLRTRFPLQNGTDGFLLKNVNATAMIFIIAVAFIFTNNLLQLVYQTFIGKRMAGRRRDNPFSYTAESSLTARKQHIQGKDMTHLTIEERYLIERMLREQNSICSIAERAGKHQPTIAREIKIMQLNVINLRQISSAIVVSLGTIVN